MFWPSTLLGALAGGLIASIPGALLGALLGQVLDRQLGLTSWAALRSRLRRSPPLKGNVLLFVMLGRLAKSNGRVSPAHIQAARAEMQRLHLDERAQRGAIDAFNRGKTGADGLRAPLRQLADDPAQGRVLLQACWRMARAEGPVANREHELILLWGGWLGWTREAVAELDGGRRQDAPISRSGAYQEALRLLGVRSDSEPEVIKRAYRRLLSRHHPDKLAGAGASAEQVREATERTRELHAAYALIRQKRGFR